MMTPAIIIGSIIAGVILVAAILVLNLTVAVGILNGLILYANIASANSSFLFPSRSIFSFTVAWMNLELGIDTCFFEGMNVYWKMWIELLFPAYVIFLIFLIINPRRMRGGYGSHRVCLSVCLSPR